MKALSKKSLLPGTRKVPCSLFSSQTPRLSSQGCGKSYHLAQPSCAKILDHLIYFFFFHESSVGSAFHGIKFRTVLSKYLSDFLSNCEL